VDEVSEPITEDELREFLEADRTPVRADPVFKRRLRDRLWDIVQTKALRRREATAASPGGGRSDPRDPPDQ
jgi:hypothetical protein